MEDNSSTPHRESLLYPLNSSSSSSSSYFRSNQKNISNSNSNSRRSDHHNHNYNSPQTQMSRMSSFHLQSSENSGFQFDNHHHHDHQTHPAVKSEASSSKLFNHSLLMSTIYHEEEGNVANGGNNGVSPSSSEVEEMKARIIAHPRYSNLLEAYMECQKIGAPDEVVVRLKGAREEIEARKRSSVPSRESFPRDPELDQFMEAYCDMLVKYKEELTRPLQEAMEFIRRIETQLNLMSPARIFNSDEKSNYSSEEDQDQSGGETELPELDPRAEDRELKNHLLRKYSGYLSSLKQELSKKRKKGKLPKEARQKLLTWWELHYKWPYPSETEKMALAESTGLDQKQINNWFINQRKRHWKPSEDMQFMVMSDGFHQQTAALYMDASHYVPDHNAPYRLGP